MGFAQQSDGTFLPTQKSNFLPVHVEVRGAYSKGGIPLNIHGIANVKLPGEEPLLNNAIERFLGRAVADIRLIAKETLEGNVRGVLAQLTPEEVNEDKTRFAQSLLEEAEHDMNRMGLVLDNLKTMRRQLGTRNPRHVPMGVLGMAGVYGLATKLAYAVDAVALGEMVRIALTEAVADVRRLDRERKLQSE